MCGFVLGQSPFNGLVLEQLNNEGSVTGTTYRIYANLSEGKLYAIYADELNPSLLETEIIADLIFIFLKFPKKYFVLQD